MKNNLFSFLLAALCSYAATAQDNDYYSSFSQFENECTDKTALPLLADKVNIRQTASSKGEIVATLPIGTMVTLKSKSDKNHSMNGHTAPWYEVSFSKDGKQLSGYVWGGLISEGFNSEINQSGDVKFVYGIEKVGKSKEGMWDVSIQLRAYKDGKELDKITFDSPSYLTSFNQLTVFNDKGIKGIKNVLQCSFSGEACGVPSGDVYVFWNGTELQYVTTTNSFSDAPVFADETLIFPTDIDGKAGKIILKSESGEYVEGKDEPEYDSRETKIFTWTGTALKSE